MVRSIKSWLRNVVPASLRRIFHRIWYHGHNRYCPFCEHSFRIFWPSGIHGETPDSLCPHCSSLDEAGAWAILQVPFDPKRTTTFEDWSLTSATDRLKAFGQEDHVRIYGQDYVERFKNAGFALREDFLQAELGTAKVELYGLPPHDRVLVWSKPA